MQNGYQVIDGDGHVNEGGPGAVDWDYYLEPAYRGRVQQSRAGPEHLGVFVDGVPVPRTAENIDPSTGKIIKRSNERPGMWDPKIRIAHMDQDGIDVAVLYGTSICAYNSDLEDAGLAAAISRAYNNWLHDFCAYAPDRLKGMASLPLQDIEASVQELKRAVKDLGFLGAAFVPDAAGRTPMDPYFFPLYETAQELDVPLGIHHLGSGRPLVPGRFNNLFFIHTYTHSFDQMLAMQCFVAGGVLDRFPRLRVGFLEGDCGWLPWWLHRMDSHYEKLREIVPAKKKPSEYVLQGEQCFVGCEGDEPGIPYVAHVVGADKMVFSSDYWHWDGTFPGAVAEMTERDDVPDDVKRKVLSDNAARLYGLS